MTRPEDPLPGDEELVAAARRGEVSAFEDLVGRYQQAVFNISYYKSGNAFDAEDLAQDVFLAAYESLDRLQNPERFGSWLFGIAYNRCHKWFQRERTKVIKIREAREQLRREASLRSATSEHERPAVSDLLARLPREIRDVLELKYLQGLSYRDIEERTGLGPQRIDYLIRKGKRLVRERMDRAREEST